MQVLPALSAPSNVKKNTLVQKKFAIAIAFLVKVLNKDLLFICLFRLQLFIEQIFFLKIIISMRCS